MRDTNLVQFYDHPAVNERDGVLFNDHRHQIKLRGSYALNDMWSFGATLSAISGGPITAFGVRWPNDNRRPRSRRVQRRRLGLALPGHRGGLRQLEPRAGLHGAGCLRPHALGHGPGRQRDLYPSEGRRGPEGALLDLQPAQQPVGRQRAFALRMHAWQSMPYFGQATVWQSPRYMQLVVSYTF